MFASFWGWWIRETRKGKVGSVRTDFTPRFSLAAFRYMES
jgi:hypothetical protein